MQLLYERYVMAEAFSLGFFVLYLLLTLRYLQQPRCTTLCLVQLLGVAVVSLRFSFLTVVLANTAFLPLLASWKLARAEVPSLTTLFRHGNHARLYRFSLVVLLHILVSLGTTFALHQAYQQVYAALSGQPPGYHSADGFMLAALFAPVIRPEDFPLPGLRTQIFGHLTYDLKDRSGRENHLFAYDGLIGKMREALPTPAEANRVAQTTAINALQRNPMGVIRLAWETTLDYFDLEIIQARIRSDLAMDASQISLYSLYKYWYSHYYDFPFKAAQPMTLAKKYYLVSIPWYWLLLLTPLFCATGLFCTRGMDRIVLLELLLASSACVVAATALAVGPIVRYLHPVAWLSFFPLAVLCRTLLRAR
jgi:hypothetical protein